MFLEKLVPPWLHTYHLVCGDSYFAAVSVDEELACDGLCFIGVAKTEIRKLLMEYLQKLKLKGVVYYIVLGVGYGETKIVEMISVIFAEKFVTTLLVILKVVW